MCMACIVRPGRGSKVMTFDILENTCEITPSKHKNRVNVMTTYPTIVGYDTLRTSSILSMKREILRQEGIVLSGGDLMRC